MPNIGGESDQQAGDFSDGVAKLEPGTQLNLENLVKIDEKFSVLVDCVKTQKVSSIS